MNVITQTLPGKLRIEGKTKLVYDIGNGMARLVAKDDITAGDGAKHDVIPDKGKLATRTTCNVFRLLKACGMDVAFEEQVGEISFEAPLTTMLPYEVVVRREAHGSALKRAPHYTKGQYFPKLIVELYLKTKDKDWKGKPLVADDPFMQVDLKNEKIKLFNPAKPIIGQEPFLTLSTNDVFTQENEPVLIERMKTAAKRAFLILEKAWAIEGRTLVDYKVEFGIDANGKLLLADVIDNDSWRVLENGAYIDKQIYRDGGGLDDVVIKYRHVSKLTDHFGLPRQQIILWCGSESDKTAPFDKALDEIVGDNPFPLFNRVVCSAHKEPIAAADLLNRLVQETPDSVIIAYVGRSNGLGPIASAQSTTPVITVPASAKEFPEDVWSSLRAPSKVPVMTVLEPSNAVLAALQILSGRNPMIYAALRTDIEKRAVNTMVI